MHDADTKPTRRNPENDATEAYAASVACRRHMPGMRACLYADGEPCACREAGKRSE